MRMWNVDPKMMCDKHLLGEHVEMHMFMGCVKKGKNIQGYIDKGLVEITHIWKRHQELAKEMVIRGMNHRSELKPNMLLLLKYAYVNNGMVNIEENEHELKKRCVNCRKLIQEMEKATT